jgi:hypothetical protein
VWRSAARYSGDRDKWSWGGRDGRNAISDAEQLLCLMYPASELRSFRLDSPDETADDVLAALRPLGDRLEIPKLLVDKIGDYMSSYVSESGRPIFAGGSYFTSADPAMELTEKQRELDVVDSFSTSISLALFTLGFLKVFSRSVHRPALRKKITDLEAATSNRLTAAMIGLLRSFAVNVFPADSPYGEALCRTINQSGRSDRVVLAELSRRLDKVRSSMRDATLGLSQDERLDNENMLFECGWSWGIVRGAPVVPTQEQVGEQPEGVAVGLPYLYFSVGALDGIADLFSERSRVLGLLNAEQLRLGQALQLRWDLTRQYWSTVARFGGEKWPLEDVPWRTTDQEQSPYFSLLVTSFVFQDLLAGLATDDDLTRTVAVLEELAVRGRVNRRIVPGEDVARDLHVAGVRLDLDGAGDLGPPMTWLATDFTAQLLKRAVKAAGLSRNSVARDKLLTVANDALAQMWRRRIRTGPAAGLWDDPSEMFPEVTRDKRRPSWYMTERAVEGLVLAAQMVDQPPIRSNALIDHAAKLLGEADHLFSQYELETVQNGDHPASEGVARIETRLTRARRLLYERPGTANALAMSVLQELDELQVARADAARSM